MRIVAVLVLLLLLTGLGAGAAYFVGRHHFHAALDASDRQAYKQAQRELEQCLRAWPWSYRGHLLAARIARRLHDRESAERHLADCERLEGRTADVTLESVLLDVQEGRISGTENALQKLVSDDNPDAPLILEALAEGYVKTFQSKKALLALNELLQRQPANHAALLLRGTVYGLLKQDEEAVRDLERAVELKPSADETRTLLAYALSKVGKVGEARAHYECLHQRQPDNAPVALGLAHCLQDLGELEQARQVLDTLLAAQPELVPALVERSRVAFRQAEPEAAEKWLRAAVRLSPFDHEAHLLLHASLAAQHKEEEADKILSVVKKLETENARLESLMAKVLERPRDLGLHCEIGVSLLRSGRDEEGLRWLQRVLEQDPGNGRARAIVTEYERQMSDVSRPAGRGS